MTGRFEGRLRVEFLDCGRKMELTEPFTYHDPSGTSWTVPAGGMTDGASIPRFLWGALGGPYEGKHRKAAVVHDHFCIIRHRKWRDVHRMFFDAMLSADVSNASAKVLYYGVLLGGPRWDEMTRQVTERLVQKSGLLKGTATASIIPPDTGASGETMGSRFVFAQPDFSVGFGYSSASGEDAPSTFIGPASLLSVNAGKAADRFEATQSAAATLSLDELEALADQERSGIEFDATALPDLGDKPGGYFNFRRGVSIVDLTKGNKFRPD